MGDSYIIKGNWQPNPTWETIMRDQNVSRICVLSLRLSPVDFIITTRWLTFHILLFPQLERDRDWLSLVPRLNNHSQGRAMIGSTGLSTSLLKAKALSIWRSFIKLYQAVDFKLSPLLCNANLDDFPVHVLPSEKQVLWIQCFLPSTEPFWHKWKYPFQKDICHFFKVGGIFCLKSCVKCYYLKNI